MKELSIIPDGMLLVRNGRIQAVGPRQEIEQRKTPEYEVVDAAGRVILPGFVDAHTHPVFAGTRVNEYELRATGATYQEIAASGGGIRSTVQKTRAASEDELFDAARRYASWFLRAGTTTIEAKSGYGLSLPDELKILRVIERLRQAGDLQYVPTFLGAHEVPDEYRENPNQYVNLVMREMLPAVAELKLAKYCDVFCEPGVFDVAASRAILTSARKLGFELRVHADQLSRSGGAELAAELGAATADHLEQIDDVGIDALIRGSRSAGTASRVGLHLGLESFSPRPQDDSGGSARRFSNRFQSRLFAHALHSFCSLACLHAHANDSCGSDHRDHGERCV